MHKHTMSLVLLVLILDLASRHCVWAASQTQGADDSVTEAVKQLWVADAGERQFGKQRLLSLGSRAIPPLVSLLAELAENPLPRYIPGKERDAADIEERLNLAVRSRNEKEFAELFRQYSKLEIRGRLYDDVLALLVELHAEEAIPILIRFLRETATGLGTFSSEPTSNEMTALIKLAPESVAFLVDALEISIAEDAPSSTEKLGVAPVAIKETPPPIQARVSIVLGEIGDERALPVLERLLLTTQDTHLVERVKVAIEKIRQKQTQRTGITKSVGPGPGVQLSNSVRRGQPNMTLRFTIHNENVITLL